MVMEPVRMAQPHQYLKSRCTQSSLMNDAGTVSSNCPYTLYSSYNTRVSTRMQASSALLGAFEKWRKGTISFVKSVRSHGTRLPPDRFSWNLIFEDFSKICRENSSFIKIGHEKRALCMKTNMRFFLSCLAHFLLWEMFQTQVVEKIKTHILCSVTFFLRKSCRLWENVEKIL